MSEKHSHLEAEQRGHPKNYLVLYEGHPVTKWLPLDPASAASYSGEGRTNLVYTSRSWSILEEIRVTETIRNSSYCLAFRLILSWHLSHPRTTFLGRGCVATQSGLRPSHLLTITIISHEYPQWIIWSGQLRLPSQVTILGMSSWQLKTTRKSP